MMLAVLAAIGLAWMVGAQPAPESVHARLLQQLDHYLADYEPKLSALIADEVFRQETPPLTTASLRPTLTRRLDSEVSFARLPGEASWIGFRKVIKIDGAPLEDRGPALAALLALGPDDRHAQAQLLVMQSSEHNLGLPRTINMPNLPLELLQPRYRHRFAIELGNADRIRGTSTLQLTFNEIAAPSIVSYGERQNLLARMEVWVDTASGAILRARVRLSAGGAYDPQIDVEFEEHKALGLLVPTRMDERFLNHGTAPGKARATYTNFRRFQTSARIVPQP